MPSAATTVDAEKVFVTRGRPVLRFTIVGAALVGIAQVLVATSALVPSLSLGDGPGEVRPAPGGVTTVTFELRNDGDTFVRLNGPRTGRAWTGPTITVADGTSTAYCLP
jgi:hypothetical protein